ncbi:ANTAR domain-containing protein [Amycolatopsis xylanica]|uniref:ANTAR domain-containing protein n=1 Tax=Amycolatopsis xylanica TaxID=589385 RepID=A0A1H3J3M5_9PSEU|nr:ANTAR domain-containing protein [Amycolatopsis xylanica]SDY34028.1 ANTAR domain-containing protein [Amycolatopsis xylanica]
MHAMTSRPPSPGTPDTASETATLRSRLRHYRRRAEQLQRALDRRLPIEQAKGILAERHQIGVDEAFVLLRAFCRNHNRKIDEVAQALVEHRLQISRHVAC